ncbi:MAG: hypothetical protein AB1898_05185 [Acidobacteriota bacterium]
MAERVLLICTAAAPKVNRALQVLREKVVRDASVDLLCTLTDLPPFEGRGDLQQRIVFPPRSDWKEALRLWARLFRERYEVVAILWCLEPGRLRAKLFALICPGRRMLVFNENLDCDYLSLRFLARLVRARVLAGTLMGHGVWRAITAPLATGTLGLLHLLLFPCRLAVLVAMVAALFLSSRFRSNPSGTARTSGMES